MIDRALAEPEGGELHTGDHAVLAFGERPDQAVGWMLATFTIYFMVKCTRISHSPDGGGEGVPAHPIIATKVRKEQQ